MTSVTERIVMHLEELKYQRLCASCWAQVLINAGYLDELLCIGNIDFDFCAPHESQF